jgi:hypothetical protein
LTVSSIFSPTDCEASSFIDLWFRAFGVRSLIIGI